ncbi:hypothetical protein pVco7_gp016 [Vibrio phage pVco-7]|uniref:Uncharacterized protein n=1 Tax=Vibrio phage pVco-5 TaxID=1965485 RepID=A0A1W6JUX3_9CAUD|nr:hypothetical protein KNT61_gp017 [Vibrio phage pVco-5]ARM71005.1 hypothetical protein pVco5_017 [Vibrio phage pVco-5]
MRLIKLNLKGDCYRSNILRPHKYFNHEYAFIHNNKWSQIYYDPNHNTSRFKG